MRKCVTEREVGMYSRTAVGGVAGVGVGGGGGTGEPRYDSSLHCQR